MHRLTSITWLLQYFWCNAQHQRGCVSRWSITYIENIEAHFTPLFTYTHSFTPTTDRVCSTATASATYVQLSRRAPQCVIYTVQVHELWQPFSKLSICADRSAAEIWRTDVAHKDNRCRRTTGESQWRINIAVTRDRALGQAAEDSWTRQNLSDKCMRLKELVLRLLPLQVEHRARTEVLLV